MANLLDARPVQDRAQQRCGQHPAAEHERRRRTAPCIRRGIVSRVGLVGAVGVVGLDGGYGFCRRGGVVGFRGRGRWAVGGGAWTDSASAIT